MYEVFENGKVCNSENFGVEDSWDHEPFDTFSEAVEFASSWLGDFSKIVTEWKANVEYDYSGCGNTICIMELS